MPLLDDVIVREAGRFKYRTGPHGAPSDAGNPLEANQQCSLGIRNPSGGTEVDYVCVRTRKRKRLREDSYMMFLQSRCVYACGDLMR
jgi:hypothetical protein